MITSSSEHPYGHEIAGWLGIPGHGVGVRELRGSNPGGTNMIFAPVFPDEGYRSTVPRPGFPDQRVATPKP